MSRAAILAASLLIPAAATAAPLDAFTAAFGADGVATLGERGYVVLQGKGAERRLAAVHWKALEALAEAAPSCRALVKGAGDASACRALPADGAVTPRLHALAAEEAAEAEERAALAASGSPAAEPAGLPNLFETPWGREFAAQRRADRLEDPAALAKPFFEEYLSGPKPEPGALKHFAAVEQASGVPDAEAAVAAAAHKGAADDALRARLRRYLQDERRRRGLALSLARQKALREDKDVRRELDALESLVSPLADKTGLLASLETAVSGAPAPRGLPRLRSAGLHLQEPTRLGQHELGDEAVVSGAYWVDGLPEGASAEIEETTFVETPRGFAALETRTVKRKDGGPYPYERRLTIAETKPFAVVALVSAASGTVVAERVEAAVAPDFELSLKREAQALQESQACDPKSAEAAYAALEGLVADAAKVKPQYAALLTRAKKGRAKAAADAETLAKLEEAVAASRADSSPQQCRYDTDRTDAAIKLARKLPAGCDRVLPELFAQRALISRRRADQEWFLRASSEARKLRRSCDLSGAARRWSEALAVLEADPAARCGKADEEAKAAEADSAAARRAQLWTATIDRQIERAQTETVPAKRLALLAPARARLLSLEDRDCRRDELKQSAKLAEKAGEDEGGPTAADAARRLPGDSTLAAVSDEVKRARARLLEKSDAASEPGAAPAAKK